MVFEGLDFMKINKYCVAMFNAYWIPAFIFYILPSLMLSMAFYDKLDIWSFIVWLVSVPCALFGMGALVAPHFGPKVLENKYLALLMAVICQLFSIVVFMASQMIMSGKIDLSSFFMLVVFFLYSLLPAMFGALLFVGGCEKILKEEGAL